MVAAAVESGEASTKIDGETVIECCKYSIENKVGNSRFDFNCVEMQRQNIYIIWTYIILFSFHIMENLKVQKKYLRLWKIHTVRSI